MKIVHLRTNHLKNPLGYDFPYLVLSWKVTEAVASGAETVSDPACEVRLIISEKEDMSLPVYDSCVMKGFGQCQIEVRFPWKARTRYFWKVMMTTPEDGRVESESAWFETAKLG